MKGKPYSFRYFKTYKFDWRLLLNHPNGEPMECKCPRGRLHSQQCPWYHPVAQSHSSQSSLPDLIGEQNGGADCPCEDDEEMLPLEGEDITEL